MSDDKTKTVYAYFETREAADRAIEHLVQQHGLNRADVFAEPKGRANSVGTHESGGDAGSALGEDDREDGATEGAIQVSVDVAVGDVPMVQEAFAEAGASGGDVR